MTYGQGIPFRSTQAYVTDVAGDDPEYNGTAAYPRTTAQGNVVGWETAVPSPYYYENYLANNVSSLAGDQVTYGQSSTRTYRFDLPATGSYSIQLAYGGGIATNNNIYLQDGTSTFATPSNVSGSFSSNSYADATGTVYTGANLTAAQNAWVAGQTAITHTFTTTILRVVIGGKSGGTYMPLSYINVQAAGSDISFNVDFAAPVGWSAGLDADKAIPLTRRTMVFFDAPIPLLRSTTNHADAPAPVGHTAGLVRDVPLPLGWASTATITDADGGMPIGWSAKLTGADAPIALAHATALLRDAVLPVGRLSALAAGSPAPVGWASRVVFTNADAGLPLQWNAGLTADGPAPLAYDVRLATNDIVATVYGTSFNAGVPVPLIRLSGFDAGSGIAMLYMAGLTITTAMPIFWFSNINLGFVTDHGIPIAWNTRGDADMSISINFQLQILPPIWERGISYVMMTLGLIPKPEPALPPFDWNV